MEKNYIQMWLNQVRENEVVENGKKKAGEKKQENEEKNKVKHGRSKWMKVWTL